MDRPKLLNHKQQASLSNNMSQGTLSQSYLRTNSIQIYSMHAAMTQEKLLTVNFLSINLCLVENAKLFKEDLLRRNVKNSSALNLQSLRLGINAIIALSNAL